MKKFKFKINESEYEVSVNEIENNIAEIEVNGTPFIVEIEKQEKLSANRKPAGKVTPLTTPTRVVKAKSIKSPLPGVIVKIMVKPGQTVKRGDVLLTMESMKMENNILAEEDTIIGTIHVQAGESVMQDDILIDFEGKEVAATAPVPGPTPAVEMPVAPKPVAKSVGTVTIKSPLPGTVIKVYVSVGQNVKRGETLLTLESMKMENSIIAEKNGVVKAIHVQAGQAVTQDESLLDLE